MSSSRKQRRAARLIGALVGAVLGWLAAGMIAFASGEGDGVAATFEEMKPYTEKVPGTTIEIMMIPIPGGEVTVGSPDDEEGRQDHEGPQFKVTIEPFWMGVYEVSWDQFDPFLNQYHDLKIAKDPSEIPAEKKQDAVSIPTPQWQEAVEIINKMGRMGGFPAAGISHHSARQYTEWVSRKTGRFYRLPTAAEWEHAARAGTTTAYSFGSDGGELGDYGWFADNSGTDDNPDGQYHKVGQKKPNPWGLHDIHGNVAEYVIDQYIEGRYGELAALSQPVGWREAITWPDAGEQFSHIVRGGSWFDFAEDCRSAAFVWSGDEWRDKDPQFPRSIWHHTDAFWVGMRLIRPLSEPAAEERLKFWQPQSDAVIRLLSREGDKEKWMLVEPAGGQ